MQKYSLKNSILLGLSLSFALPLSISLPLTAAIPAGTLTESEAQQVAQSIAEIKKYTEDIRKVTGNLFTGATPFAKDFATLTQLRDEIIAIHNRITPSGSQLSQVVLINLKGLAHHLSEAQKKWITTLQTKSLLTMGKNRRFMSTRHDDCLRYLLGAKRGRTHAGDGLIGCLESSGNSALRSEGESILTNVEFIFNYAKATRKKEIDLAVHLIKYKGFTPRFIKQIAWLLS